LGAERIPAHMAASRRLASRCECVTLPSGAAKTTRWQKSRRYRISSGFLNGSDILPKMVMRRSAVAGRRRRAPEVVRTCAGGGPRPVLTSYIVVMSTQRAGTALCAATAVSMNQRPFCRDRESREFGSAKREAAARASGATPVMCRAPGAACLPGLFPAP